MGALESVSMNKEGLPTLRIRTLDHEGTVGAIP